MTASLLLNIMASRGSKIKRDKSVARARWTALLLASLLLGIISHFMLSQGAQPVPSPHEGKQLFQMKCTACHTIGEGIRVGPDLKGVTERRDLAWLKRFILEPDQMFREEDPIALAMLKEFGIPMPNLGLTASQVETIIAYLKTAATETAPVAIPALYIPTLAMSIVAIIALTVIGLIAGTKRVEVRP